MKTIEQVKQEFKEFYAAKGRDLKLPIYTYKGKLGVIYEVDYPCCCGVPEFIPMDEFLAKDDIGYDRVQWVNVGADGCEEGEEITDRPIRNEENAQKLLVDCVWSTVECNKSDEFCRELLVTTDQYYRWTSERKKMIESIQQMLEKYDEELSCYDGIADDELESDERKDRDEWIEYLKDRIKSHKNDWEETCSKYEDPLEWRDYEHNSIDFENVYEEAISYGHELSGIVKKAAREAINDEE